MRQSTSTRKIENYCGTKLDRGANCCWMETEKKGMYGGNLIALRSTYCSLKICLELGGPFTRGPPGLCPPCPPHCYATECGLIYHHCVKYFQKVISKMFIPRPVGIALGYMLTPFGFFPGDVHVFQVAFHNVRPVYSWSSWLPVVSFQLPLFSLVRYSGVLHSYDMSQPP